MPRLGLPASEFLGCNLIFLTEAWFGLLNCGRYWLFLPKFCCRHFQLYLENERCGKQLGESPEAACRSGGLTEPLSPRLRLLFWVCWSFLGNKSMFSVELKVRNREARSSPPLQGPGRESICLSWSWSALCCLREKGACVAWLLPSLSSRYKGETSKCYVWKNSCFPPITKHLVSLQELWFFQGNHWGGVCDQTRTHVEGSFSLVMKCDIRNHFRMMGMAYFSRV